MPPGRIHTIPIRLEPCCVPEEFSHLNWCDLFEPDGFDQLVKAINYGLTQRRDMGGVEPSQAESSIDVEEPSEQALPGDSILQDEFKQEVPISETSLMDESLLEEEDRPADRQIDLEDDQEVYRDEGIDNHKSNHTSQDRQSNRIADDEELVNADIPHENFNINARKKYLFSSAIAVSIIVSILSAYMGYNSSAYNSLILGGFVGTYLGLLVGGRLLDIIDGTFNFC